MPDSPFATSPAIFPPTLTGAPSNWAELLSIIEGQMQSSVAAYEARIADLEARVTALEAPAP